MHFYWWFWWSFADDVIKGLTSYSTLYRSFQRQLLHVRWLNQQRQRAEGSQSVTEISFQSRQTMWQQCVPIMHPSNTRSHMTAGTVPTSLYLILAVIHGWCGHTVNSILQTQLRLLYRSNRIHKWRRKAISQSEFVIANNRQTFFVPQLHCTVGTEQEYRSWLAIWRTSKAGN